MLCKPGDALSRKIYESPQRRISRLIIRLFNPLFKIKQRKKMTIETQVETRALASDLPTSPLRIKPYYEVEGDFRILLSFPYFVALCIDNRISNIECEANSRNKQPASCQKVAGFYWKPEQRAIRDVNFIVYFTI